MTCVRLWAVAGQEAEARLKDVEEEGKERSQLSTALTQKLEQVRYNRCF